MPKKMRNKINLDFVLTYSVRLNHEKHGFILISQFETVYPKISRLPFHRENKNLYKNISYFKEVFLLRPHE